MLTFKKILEKKNLGGPLSNNITILYNYLVPNHAIYTLKYFGISADFSRNFRPKYFGKFRPKLAEIFGFGRTLKTDQVQPFKSRVKYT